MSNKKELIFYSTSIITLGYAFFQSVKYIYKKLNKNKNSKIKGSILEMMKETPLLYIKSLSELTGCKIYGKCEYMLPYTSKDRMIRNIILNAQEYK